MRFRLTTAFIFFFAICVSVAAGSFPYRLETEKDKGNGVLTVVGFFQHHTIKQKETLLDVARDYGLGYNEISLEYPEIDPWIPKADQTLVIPTCWVLPSTKKEEVVINIPEMRLYRFYNKIGMVKTYPIGIGREGFETPVGISRVIARETDPTWTVPPSAIESYGKIVVPAGPNNPLGRYWVGLSADHIGIHGTNNPWGVGRQVSRGCIRLYPEHIELFYNEVTEGTTVEIVYEPVKIGIRDDVVYMEVHPDIYKRIPDLVAFTEDLFRQKGLWEKVDVQRVYECLKKQTGVPVEVGHYLRGGDLENSHYKEL